MVASQDARFGEDDWGRSMLFSALVLVWCAASFMIFKQYIFYFYPSLRPVFKEFFFKPHLEPAKLGYQMMIVTILGVGVVKMFMSYSRIWWVESDICQLDAPVAPAPSPSPTGRVRMDDGITTFWDLV